MKSWLQWIEPVECARRTARTKLVDFLISFGVSTIAGLGFAVSSGSMMDIPLGSGSSLSVPAHAWQYGLWLLVCVVGGCGGWWIVSLGGRAEVNLGDGGIIEIRHRIRRFYSYAELDRCEIVQKDKGAYLLLRLHLRPQLPAGVVTVRELGISKRIDPARVCDVLRAHGVTIVESD